VEEERVLPSGAVAKNRVVLAEEALRSAQQVRPATAAQPRALAPHQGLALAATMESGPFTLDGRSFGQQNGSVRAELDLHNYWRVSVGNERLRDGNYQEVPAWTLRAQVGHATGNRPGCIPLTPEGRWSYGWSQIGTSVVRADYWARPNEFVEYDTGGVLIDIDRPANAPNWLYANTLEAGGSSSSYHEGSFIEFDDDDSVTSRATLWFRDRPFTSVLPRYFPRGETPGSLIRRLHVHDRFQTLLLAKPGAARDRVPAESVKVLARTRPIDVRITVHFALRGRGNGGLAPVQFSTPDFHINPENCPRAGRPPNDSVLYGPTLNEALTSNLDGLLPAPGQHLSAAEVWPTDEDHGMVSSAPRLPPLPRPSGLSR
jgi:hypothetical protein